MHEDMSDTEDLPLLQDMSGTEDLPLLEEISDMKEEEKGKFDQQAFYRAWKHYHNPLS
jgi:hypothetical protein